MVVASGRNTRPTVKVTGPPPGEKFIKGEEKPLLGEFYQVSSSCMTCQTTPE